MPSLCSSIKQEYEALKTVTQEFVSACATAGDPRAFSAEQLRTLQLLKQRVETARDALKDKLFVSPETAREIMGKDHVFSREEIHTAFGFDIPAKDLPPIRWSTKELKEAHTRGDYLIYRTDHIPDGTPEGTPSSLRQGGATKGAAPLTMEKIAELVQTVLTANNQGKARYDGNNWCENEPFYTQEKPRSGWALVSKEPLSDSTSKNYLQQTDRIVKELQTLYPATDTCPIAKTAHKAIEEFHSKRTTIEQLIKDNKWKEAADILESLSITQQTRHTAPEALYDVMLLRASTKSDSLLSNIYTWTSTRSSSGLLVGVGDAGADGASVYGWGAGFRLGHLGVLFVRRGPGVSRPS